jgi:hypothetical protein
LQYTLLLLLLHTFEIKGTHNKQPIFKHFEQHFAVVSISTVEQTQVKVFFFFFIFQGKARHMKKKSKAKDLNQYFLEK